MSKKIIFSIIFIGILSWGISPAFAANIATVVTGVADNIDLRAGNLHGSVVNDGGSSAITGWFVFGEDANYGSKTETIKRTGNGDFTVRATGLKPCTVYHYRAVAQNSAGIAYGIDKMFTTQCARFELKYDVQNLTLRDTIWYSQLRVQSGDFLKFRLTINSTGDVVLQDITVNVKLPANIFYKGNLIVKDIAYAGDITRGSINVGNLLPGDSKIITFEAEVGPSENFYLGENVLASQASAFSTDFSGQASCNIVVNGTGVVKPSTGGTGNNGAVNGATNVATGISDSIFQSLLLPFIAAGLLVWLFQSRLLGLEQWAQARREKTEQFRASKKLKQKIDAAKNGF